LAKKAYTILIFSQKAAEVKRFILSPLVLKIGAAVLGLLIVVSAVILYDYVIYKQKVIELKSLRAETESQQEEIRSFQEKITILEEQLDKLKEMEKQVEKDLKEVTDLKKEKKTPLTAPAHKKSSNIKKEIEVSRKVSIPSEEKVSLLEQERPRLVNRLQLDLLELQKKAFLRQQNLKELQEFLQTQKSILLSTPSLWPVMGRVSSTFGESRMSSSSGGVRPHKGLDICVAPGTPIVATADGVVSFSGSESEYGRLICIEHGHGFSTAYGHLQKLQVQAGDKVTKGQVIGTVGLSGNSTGPHVHYEVRMYNSPVNPSRFLN
jgi:murein DD-endopeptidase MepM/ murein hydrolase activator NlpD